RGRRPARRRQGVPLPIRAGPVGRSERVRKVHRSLNVPDPEKRRTSLGDIVTNNYVWRSIFRHGYADTPRNRILQLSANVWLHMLRVFMTGSYKPPREFNWVVGVNLLTLTLLLSFTGYLLPWDQLAIWAVTVGTNMARATPLLGTEGPFGPQLGMTPRYDARALLTAGTVVGAPTLLRFYVLHCIFIPVIASILMILHFWP